MKIRGRLREFDFDFNQGKHFVSFTIEEGNLEEVNGLKNRLLSIEFKDVERAKTISQNRYYWTIVSNIADSINSSKEEVYNQHLLNYGHVVAEFKANKEQDLVSNDLHMIRYKSGRKFNFGNAFLYHRNKHFERAFGYPTGTLHYFNFPFALYDARFFDLFAAIRKTKPRKRKFLRFRKRCL